MGYRTASKANGPRDSDHSAPHRKGWLRRIRAGAVLGILLRVGVVCAPAAAQVTQLPTWKKQSPTASPTARVYPTMAYDAMAGNVVLFGGENFSGANGALNVLSDTWTWNGSTWTQENPTNYPPARSSATMAYDPAADNMVLFGGQTGSASVLGDTWVWNGSAWTEASTTGPPARSGATMAFDAATGNVVLFGGLPSSSSYSCRTCLNDTWAWNGSAWTEEFPATSPPVRYLTTMAYDAATGNVVLFGGAGSNAKDLNDTWVWNGSTWNEEFPAVSPPARAAAAMAYDAATGNVVLLGA